MISRRYSTSRCCHGTRPSIPQSIHSEAAMARSLVPDATSVGTKDKFSGNFTKAFYLRARKADELEKLIGYGAGRLAKGWWLLFATEKPLAPNFEFGGYNYFSGSRIGNPGLGAARPTVEDSLTKDLGGPAGVLRA